MPDLKLRNFYEGWEGSTTSMLFEAVWCCPRYWTHIQKFGWVLRITSTLGSYDNLMSHGQPLFPLRSNSMPAAVSLKEECLSSSGFKILRAFDAICLSISASVSSVRMSRLLQKPLVLQDHMVSGRIAWTCHRALILDPTLHQQLPEVLAKWTRTPLEWEACWFPNSKPTWHFGCCEELGAATYPSPWKGYHCTGL